MYATLVLLAFATTTALVAWAIGRSLRRAVADPLLVERVDRQRRRLALVVAVASMLAAWTIAGVPWFPGAGAAHAGTVPLFILCVLVNSLAAAAGGFGLRVVLFEEKITLAVYLGHTLRRTLGLGGFWLCLLVVPFAVHATGSWGWLVGGLLAMVFAAWLLCFPRVTCALLGARPVDDPALCERIAEVSGRARSAPGRAVAPGPKHWCSRACPVASTSGRSTSTPARSPHASPSDRGGTGSGTDPC